MGEHEPYEELRPTEPYEPRPGRRIAWPFLAVAALAAVGGALLAPDPWPAGEGSVQVEYRERLAAAADVRVGEAEPLTIEGRADGAEIAVELPSGVPTDATVEALVGVSRDGASVRPGLDEVQLTVVLPDGRREPIPALRWDPEERRLIAERRPPVDAATVLGLLGAVVVLWVTEAVPLFVTSLTIPVVLVVGDVGTAAEALAPFFHPIIALFFAGFLMAEAMRRTRLDHLAAVSIVARAGRSPATLFAALVATAGFMSMWMSNTAAVAVLIPIALAVTSPLGSEGYRKAVILGIAYAATIGGVGSAIGTPANPLAIAFLADFVGREVSFVGWFGFGLPMVALFLPVMGVYLWRLKRARPEGARFEEARRVARDEVARAGRPTRDQTIVLAVFAGVMVVWLTQIWHGLDTGIVALAGAIVLALLGKIRPEDLGRISWASLITFGGGLTLGFFLVESGTSDWVATRLEGLAGVPEPLAVAAVAVLALGLTTVASNTATAAMLVPLAIPLAGLIGVDPVLLVAVVAIASSIDFALVVGTPPTMLAYATDLYTTREIFRTGIVLDFVGIALLVAAVVPVWQLMGLQGL